MIASDSLSALEALRPPTNLRGKHVSWVLAVAMHIALAAFLIYGISWQTKPPETVSVDLVRTLPPINAAAPAPTSEASNPPIAEPAPKPVPEPPKVQPRIEPNKPAPVPGKADIAVKERPRPAVVKPAPVVTPPPPDPFKQELNKEALRLDKQKMASQAEKELDSLRQAQASSSKKKLTEVWISQIQAKVRGNIVLPSQVKGNPEAVFDVTQLPSGEILTVHLKQSCGNAMLDTAIERAILKSSPLPKPDRADLFERALELRVRPVEKE